ncbi:hypothetical protein ACFC26_34615 [Kitasatospora purpeofusca]|uniref:hypothetical protein n=1 Tax=Kitasatospora purpeofusca TaxID=67352 RepID=UPI0035E37836
MLLRPSATTVLTVLGTVCVPVAPSGTVHAAAPEGATCPTNAAVSFSPPLSATPRATTVATAGTVSGCADSQTAGSAITGGTGTTTLHVSSLSCNPFLPATLMPGSEASFAWNPANGTSRGSTAASPSPRSMAGAP